MNYRIDVSIYIYIYIRWRIRNLLTYLFLSQDVENIIEKDFFPDLPDLKSKAEYFEALEKNDLVKLRKFQLKFTGGRPSTNVTDCEYKTILLVLIRYQQLQEHYKRTGNALKLCIVSWSGRFSKPWCMFLHKNVSVKYRERILSSK